MSKKNGGPAPSEQVYIEYWPLSKFVPAQRNPKLHDLEEIALSIRRFGFVSPGVVNEATGRAVVGHGRVDALALYKERHDKGEDGWTTVPRRIVEKDGEWWFPVERGVSFDSDAEAEAYLLADNRLTEMGGWDERSLSEVLTQLGDLKGLGWSPDSVASLQAFTSMLPDGDTSFALDNLNFEPPPVAPRVIVRCSNTTEMKKLQVFLGLEADPERVLFNYSDTVVGKRKRKK